MPSQSPIKATKTKVLSYFPTNNYGFEGDIVLAKIKGKGTFLCAKAGGVWYTPSVMNELRRSNSSYIKQLKVDNLTFRGISNAENDSDKFLVGDGNSVKYRTSKQALDDLDVFVNDISYKQAYCSLGQHIDKDSCEANGGIWYYSDNDSHDSISSTPENELLTVGSSIGKLDAESTLLYDGSTLEIKRNTDFDDNWQTSAQTDLLKLTYDSDNYAIFNISDAGRLTIDTTNDIILDVDGGQVNIKDDGASHFVFDCDTTSMTIYDDTDSDDYVKILVAANGATTMSTNDNDGTAGHLTIQPDGDLILDPASQSIIINATDKLYFDGGGNTYIYEASACLLRFYVGGVLMFEMREDASTGDLVNFGASTVGFTQFEPTYDATDTNVLFQHNSNKAHLTFGSGSITDLNLKFPNLSCNCVLLITQDGTGSRTITNYKTFDQVSGNESTVLFAGGSNPTLTTTGDKTDIISFYWDNDNHKAYGTVTFNF